LHGHDGTQHVPHESQHRGHSCLHGMPLCTFLKQAHYSGNGDVNSAANWACTANEDLLQFGPNGALAGLEGPQR
jgi:hypothetical protein